jgi:hypothetical protein
MYLMLHDRYLMPKEIVIVNLTNSSYQRKLSNLNIMFYKIIFFRVNLRVTFLIYNRLMRCITLSALLYLTVFGVAQCIKKKKKN